jgi:CDP-glycerol glycerophosphotransferase
LKWKGCISNAPAVSTAVVGMIAPSPIRDSGRLTVVADDRSELSIRPVAMPVDPVVVKNVDFRGRDVTVSIDGSAKVHGLALHTVGNKVELDSIGPSIYSTTLPELPERFRTHGERQWKLTAKNNEGNDLDVYHASVDYLLPGTSCVRLAANPAGKVRLEQRFRRVTVTGATNDRDRLLIIGRIDPPEKLKVVLKSSEQTVEPAETAFHSDGSFTAVYDLTTTGAEGGKVAALAGGYHVRYGETSKQAEGWARTADKLAIRPVDCFTEWNTLRVEGKNSGVVSVMASPPWSVKERTKYHRFQLRNKDWGPITDGIVFESYNGKSANDNPRAIFDAISAIRGDIPLYWSVRDRRVDVPSQGIPVVEGTTEWHRALANSRIWINNNNFPFHVRKRPGQYYLQTWHGTPIKKLLWDMPTRKVPLSYRRLMKQQVPQWDLLFAQSDEAAIRLRNGLGYSGQIKIMQYPRNIRLTEPKMNSVDAKARLGIGEHEPIVLYVPTWRDSHRNSSGLQWAEFLDLERFSTEINAKVLIRAHHMSNMQTSALSNVIDVSSCPHVEDILSITDILVTDYSSISEDFALTGRHVIKFVPDLEDYQRRRGLYNDATGVGVEATNSSSNSALVCRTQDELIEAVRSLLADGLGIAVEPAGQPDIRQQIDHVVAKLTSRAEAK